MSEIIIPERSFKECVCFTSKLSINVAVVCVIRVGLFMVGIMDADRKEHLYI